MAYVKRDQNSNIIAVFESAQADVTECVPLDTPELLDFLRQSTTTENARIILSKSDRDLIRVIEDLINTLIDKKILMFTDLPLAAREKLTGREKIRGHLNDLNDLMNDDPDIL